MSTEGNKEVTLYYIESAPAPSALDGSLQLPNAAFFRPRRRSTCQRFTGRYWCGCWRIWWCDSSKLRGLRPSGLAETNEVVLGTVVNRRGADSSQIHFSMQACTGRRSILTYV